MRDCLEALGRNNTNVVDPFGRWMPYKERSVKDYWNSIHKITSRNNLKKMKPELVQSNLLQTTKSRTPRPAGSVVSRRETKPRRVKYLNKFEEREFEEPREGEVWTRSTQRREIEFPPVRPFQEVAPEDVLQERPCLQSPVPNQINLSQFLSTDCLRCMRLQSSPRSFHF